jgi:hypothetical protein
MRPRIAFALASALLLAPAAAHAERDVALPMLGSGYADAGFGAITAGAIVFGTLTLTPRLGDHAPLDGLGHRDRSDTFEQVSNIAFGATILGNLALGYGIESAHGQSGMDRWRAPLILAEGALLGSAIIQMTKNLGGVCRPRDWNDATQRCTTEGESGADGEERILEAHRSFPSGHTTPLAGMAGAAWGLWLLPSGHRSEFIPLVIGSTGLALSMVAFRPLAGAHSWVDTGTGFLVGGLSGFLTALLHTRSTTTSVTASPGPAGPQMSLSMQF